jgi:hypothetical protein
MLRNVAHVFGVRSFLGADDIQDRDFGLECCIRLDDDTFAGPDLPLTLRAQQYLQFGELCCISLHWRCIEALECAFFETGSCVPRHA